MADEGAHVVVTDLDEPSAKATADEIKAAGGSAEAIKLAVQDLDGLRADRTACAAWPAVFEHGLHAPPAVSAIWHAPSSEGVV
jgi:NAD(P)-dependent dehydrogenase (short-subunit alcohol dehydrogenase family)